MEHVFSFLWMGILTIGKKKKNLVNNNQISKSYVIEKYFFEFTKKKEQNFSILGPD